MYARADITSRFHLDYFRNYTTAESANAWTILTIRDNFFAANVREIERFIRHSYIYRYFSLKFFIYCLQLISRAIFFRNHSD